MLTQTLQDAGDSPREGSRAICGFLGFTRSDPLARTSECCHIPFVVHCDFTEQA